MGGWLIYKCNRFPNEYFAQPQSYSQKRKHYPMNDNTNSVDIMALTVFKRELIDIDVLGVTVDPIIRDYLRDRISQMEGPPV